jgi:hypothetical protein
MPNVLINSMNTGEISGLCESRSDLAKFSSACKTLENFVPLVEGGAKKMPGTYFAGTTANGGAMFTASIAGTTMTVTAVNYGVLQVGQTIVGGGVASGTTVSAYGTGTGGVGAYTITPTQTVGSEIMQTASNGQSRLVPFQYSTEQGAVLEFSAGMCRVWEGATQGSWALGLAEQSVIPAGGINYNPATAYVSTNKVLVGSSYLAYMFDRISGTEDTTKGVLYISIPYGEPVSSLTGIGSISINTSDSLSVFKSGVSPNQIINIALANTTASNNSASAIQAAIRALGSLNSPSYGYVDLSAWCVTPDAIYYATPWTSLPVLYDFQFPAYPFNWIGECVASNQYNQFPVILTNILGLGLSIAWNATYWGPVAAVQEPIDLVTPYLETDLFALDCSTQSADVLWIFHPNYPPGIIERLSENSWQYSLSLPGQQPGEPAYRGTLDVVKTGYSALGQNITLISQANPCVIVLASSPSSQPFQDGSRIYINECSGLVSLNEGEFFVSGMTYGSVTVSVTDSSGTTTTVTGVGWSFTPQDPNTGASIDSSSYQQYTGGGFAVQVVAMFAATGDYPACGALYQERLCVGGSNNNPTQMNGSTQDDYPDFICDPNADDYAVQYTLVSNKVNQLLNMVGTPNALVIGTSGGVWIVAGSNNSSLSQTNVNALQQSSEGVSALQPQVVNGSAIFVSRSSRIVTFLAYNFVTNQWDNTDLTRLNRNITIGTSAAMSGIAQTAFSIEPYPIYWGVRNDGQLIGLVFNTQDQVYAWFRVNMGAGLIESVAVISGQNQEDQIVVVVNRTINGVTQRCVEYFMPQELFGQLSNAFFVNCGLQWQGVGPFNITGITNANPAVVTAPGHTLVNGQTVAIAGVLGMTQVNTNPLQAWTVANVSGNTFQLQGSDSTAWGDYTGGGTVEQVTNQVTGMSYLMGQNVTAVGDEAVIYTGIVTADTVVFGSYANQVTIGLPYSSTIEPMNPVLGDQKNTSKSKRQKFTRVNLSMYESVGGMVGTDSTHLYNIDYTQGTPNPLPPGSPATLFTGNVINDLDAEWTDGATITIVHSDPFPYTLRSVTPRLSVAEEG